MIANQFTVEADNVLIAQNIPCAMCGQGFKAGERGVLVPMPGEETGFYTRASTGENLPAIPVHVPCIERSNDLFAATAEFGRFVLMVMDGTIEWGPDMLDIMAGKAVNLGLAEMGPGMMFKSRFNNPPEPAAETAHSDQPAPDTNENSGRTDEGAGGHAPERGDQRGEGA